MSRWESTKKQILYKMESIKIQGHHDIDDKNLSNEDASQYEGSQLAHTCENVVGLWGLPRPLSQPKIKNIRSY